MSIEKRNWIIFLMLIIFFFIGYYLLFQLVGW